MKLVPSQPVTIVADRVNRKYIPHMANFPSGLLRMSLGIGPDNNFTPNCSYHSHDGGKTWHLVDDLCPRTEFNTVLSNGSYFEIDDYWFQDFKHSGVYFGNGGFSTNEKDLHHEYVEIHAPSTVPKTLRSMRQFGQPQNPWFDLINKANQHNPSVTLDTVLMGGTVLTAIVESGSPKHLLGVGYENVKGYNKHVVLLYDSRDGGSIWHEQSVILSAEEMPEGCNETAFERLANGDLYVMTRTGSLLLHARSSDEGKSWTKPTPVQLVDTREYITGVWPIVRKLRGGALVCTYGRPKSTFTTLDQAKRFDYVAEHYGHCGKFVMIDPTGTGNHWQGRIDLHQMEVELQALMGVPENQRLRVQEDTNVRDSNSWEYLSVNEVAENELLVTYDVQRFRENWNSHPVQGVRMVRVRVVT